MGNKRMAAVADFTAQAGGFRSGLGPVELIALVNNRPLNTVQAPEEIEMPPGAAEFAVRHSEKPHFLLLRHKLDDFGILNLF
ncbi:hypothetical protein D3C80_1929210 [compost metagenome]